jgi:hypothetical protein
MNPTVSLTGRRRPPSRSWPAAIAGLLLLASCGGAGGKAEGVGSNPGCIPHGPQLRVTVMDTNYDTECLAAPADTPFNIRFDNEDSNTHNLDILRTGVSLFSGDIVVGPKVVTYRVGPLPAGRYDFRCDVHPHQMFGTFVVGG